MVMIPRIDLTGQRFGRWIVLSEAPRKSGHRAWHCQCDCGTTRDVVQHVLRSGESQSCGCYNREMTSQSHYKHGHAVPPNCTHTYRIWQGMLGRCSNPNYPKWRNYGGKGITVCDRWRTFENFLADMGECPSDNHSIDRICSNGNYEPANTRWSDRYQQANNKTNNVVLEFQGRRLTMAEWAKELDISYNAIQFRLQRGWNIEDTLTVSVRKVPDEKILTCNGESHNVKEWCKKFGMPYSTLQNRLKRGWSIEESLSIPIRDKKKS